MWHVRGVIIAMALAMAGLGLASKAEATVLHPALNPIDGSTWNVSPAFLDSWLATDSNTDVGPQAPHKVELVLESPSWINAPLTFVSGGSCEIASNCTANEDAKSGTWTYSGIPARVFAVHFDGMFLAFLFASDVTSFFITGLPHGVSNIYAYRLSEVPLPGAVWLMGSVLAAWLGFGRWRQRAA